MGSFFGYYSRADLVAEITQGAVMSAATDHGSKVWTLHTTPAGQGVITLFLVMHHGGDWGYKPIEETMGPYHYGCPAKILDAADRLGPAVTDTAREWRAACRETAARRSRKFAPGTILQVMGRSYRVESYQGRSCVVTSTEPGQEWRRMRMTARHVGAAQVVSAEGA